MGRVISPQNFTIAATAVGLVGREPEILRRVIWWSLGMGLQSSVLSWRVPTL